MLDIIEEDDGAVAVRVTGSFTKADYDKLYNILAGQTAQHGTVDVFEALTDFGFAGFLSTFIGIYHDLRYRNTINLGKTAVVSNSAWARLETKIWSAITPLWPISPEELRYFPMHESRKARRWILST